jgi:hypothetical protein
VQDIKITLDRNKKTSPVRSQKRFKIAPRVGFEPTTDRLTADCSATELPRKVLIIKSVHKKTGFEPTPLQQLDNTSRSFGIHSLSCC